MKQLNTTPTTKNLFINKIIPSFIKGMNQALTATIVIFIVLAFLKVV